MARLRNAGGKWRPVLENGALGAPVPEPTPEEKELSAAQEAALGLPLVKVSLRGGGPCPCCGARLEFVENRKCAACGNDFWQEGDAPSVEKPS
jgi:hypothetical protein